MGLFSSLFSGKQQRLAQIFAAQQAAIDREEQQRLSAEAKAQSDAMLEGIRTSSQAQLDALAKANADAEARFGEERTRSASELDALRAGTQSQVDAIRASSRAALEQANRESETLRAQAEETARAAQKAAEEANYRASLTPADSEEARQTADRRLRRVQSQRGFASTVISRAGNSLGQPSVTTPQLLGA